MKCQKYLFKKKDKGVSQGGERRIVWVLKLV